MIVLKYLGSKRIGCAAGGEPIYTRAMYRDGKHRTEVQAIIKRADRVQMAFIFFGLTILSMSGLFLSYGLTNVIWAASDIRDTNEVSISCISSYYHFIGMNGHKLGR